MIFWDVMYSSLIDGIQCFWIPFWFKLYFKRELEVFIHFLEKSVPAYKTTQHRIPEEHKLYAQHYEKPKSHTKN